MIEMSLDTNSKVGSVAGGVLLIAGCCIGAGMLGLPVFSALAGFIPSVLLFLFSWLFMLATGLLLLEATLYFKDDVNIITMAGRTIGPLGKIVGWAGFLFLFYALMVAYISGTGELVVDFAKDWTGYLIPSWIGAVFTSLLFGYMVYLGTKAVDWFNRLFMVGLIASYALLVLLGSSHVNTDYLVHRDWSVAYLVVPAMIISFGYHNLVPTLANYLQRDQRKLVTTILLGSAIPLVVYLIWEWLILGLVPVEGEGGFREAFGQGDMATRVLKNAIGASWVTDLAQYFAFFAIITSFLGVALSFVDFLADGLHVKKDAKGTLFLCVLVIALPLVFALIYPKMFLLALSYAGSFGAVTLFGLLPAVMVWRGRYCKKMGTTQLLPGGKASLILIMVIAIGVMALQLMQDLGRIWS